MNHIKFYPTDGIEVPYGIPLTLAQVRRAEASVPQCDMYKLVWMFNPWAGKLRDLRYVKQDPYGKGIVPGGTDPKTLAFHPLDAGAPPDSALQVQEGGNHYKDMKIQPVEFIHANGIPFAEGNVIKYVCRWRNKNGIKDLKKARHFLDLLIELEEKAGGEKP